MCQIREEDLWKKADLWVVTTNGTVGKHGLIMGVGAAKQAADKYHGLAAEAGKVVALRTQRLNNRAYGFATLPNYPIGLFQVKYDWRDKAEMMLIRLSAVLLAVYADEFPTVSIRMNFPGIGYGGRISNRAEIEKALSSTLPDNVTVCYF